MGSSNQVAYVDFSHLDSIKYISSKVQHRGNDKVNNINVAKPYWFLDGM